MLLKSLDDGRARIFGEMAKSYPFSMRKLSKARIDAFENPLSPRGRCRRRGAGGGGGGGGGGALC